MAIKTIDLTRFLSEEIRNKYEFFVKDDFRTSANMSIDSFFPKLFNQQILKDRVRVSDTTFPSSAFAISEFVANSLNVRKAHISELCKVLNFTEAEIKTLLLSVKRKKFDLVLVGFGGTGVNFNYWLQELASWTHTVNIFDKIIVNDNDTFTLSNVIRLPIDTRTYLSYTNKRLMFNNAANLTNKVQPESSDTYAQVLSENTEIRERTIFYGAPDISTRKILSERDDVKFISATHAGNDAQLFLNPPQDDDIQIETYGQINLSVFFMNHLMMTIRFLEFLANSDGINWNQSGEIMDYNFKEEYNAERTNQNGRLYRFPCLTNEEQDLVDERNRNAREGDELTGLHGETPATEAIIQEAPEPPTIENELNEIRNIMNAEARI